MSARIVKKLDVQTLSNVVNFQSKQKIEGNKRDLTKQLSYDIECAGVKHLVYTIKKKNLEAAVAYLNVDHGDNNASNRMVLSKRLMESMTQSGVGTWVRACDNQSIIRNFAKCLEIKGYSGMPVRALKDAVIKEIDIIGSQIVFGNLTLKLLKECCEAANIENYSVASTKTPLIQALTCNIPIGLPEKKQKTRTRKPKFATIDECETYDQLFQYYKLENLVAWCKENGLKSSGTKKVVINRILAYHSGDKENTMADPERLNRKKSTKAKKVDTKEYPAPSRVSKRQMERNQAMVESSDEEEEDDVMMDVSEEEMDVSQEEDENHPSTVEGLSIALYGKCKSNEIKELIERNGGQVYAGSKLKKSVIVLCDDAASDKFVKVAKQGIRVVERDFLDNLE